ncbi:hypothetical protein HOLleu_28300 [Holothuria leucospilota]|uniref:Ig-like domain-containing protein n=1 Tax=Holothuria leucospilota TaxID=206669 RepID=A0A9Q1BLS6_HOLLE|nr:hypothetical protein HOLleu_28300 [Holothuria leucospilota]
MDIRILLTLALMWSITIVHCENPCASSSVQLLNIRGLYQQNVDLVCNATRNCSRVYWTRNGEEVETEDTSQKCTGCDYKVSNNEFNSTYILGIYNLSENAKGVYLCYCHSRIPNSKLYTSTTEGCYNLTLYTLNCGMKTSINGEETVTYNGSHLSHTTETLEANINDVLSVTCLDDQQKRTNCSELEKYKHGVPGNERVDGLISNLNSNLVNKLDSRSDLNENVSDIESDSFSSEEEDDPQTIIGLKERKERLTSLHIYEDAYIGGTS